jgi:hypothetical protein
MNLGPNAVNNTFRFLLNQSGTSITLGDNTPVNWEASNIVTTTGLVYNYTMASAEAHRNALGVNQDNDQNILAVSLFS